jgi:hypothetical protein
LVCLLSLDAVVGGLNAWLLSGGSAKHRPSPSDFWGEKSKFNKKFWEELIAYFPRYDMGHTEIDALGNVSAGPFPRND